jgi:hypothetical protein
MSTIPYDSREQVLVWCAARVEAFAAHQEAVGLSPSQVEEFTALTALLAEHEREAAEARARAEAATLRVNSTFARLRKAMVNAVADVRREAEATGNPQVYALALVPPRAFGKPAPAPQRPTQLAAQLANAGSSEGGLVLSWQCRQPRNVRGTMYIVSRQLPGDTTFTTLGIVGARRFVDETLPAGVGEVTYTVQAVRGTRVGGGVGGVGPTSAQLTVKLGNGQVRRAGEQLVREAA